MDSCAIGKDGKLLDATDIEWFKDADNTHLLPPISSEVCTLTDLVAEFISAKATF